MTTRYPYDEDEGCLIHSTLVVKVVRVLAKASRAWSSF